MMLFILKLKSYQLFSQLVLDHSSTQILKQRKLEGKGKHSHIKIQNIKYRITSLIIFKNWFSFQIHVTDAEKNEALLLTNKKKRKLILHNKAPMWNEASQVSLPNLSQINFHKLSKLMDLFFLRFINWILEVELPKNLRKTFKLNTKENRLVSNIQFHLNQRIQNIPKTLKKCINQSLSSLLERNKFHPEQKARPIIKLIINNGI